MGGEYRMRKSKCKEMDDYVQREIREREGKGDGEKQRRYLFRQPRERMDVMTSFSVKVLNILVII